MSPIEMQEHKKQQLDELNALKKLFGGLLLESSGAASPDDIAYYQRKFKEAQQRLKGVARETSFIRRVR
jgi:hypothetical protein